MECGYKIQYRGFLLVDLSAHTVFNFIQVTVCVCGGGGGTMASGQESKNVLEGWPIKILRRDEQAGEKKNSTVLLYCSIVLQHMHKLALGYAGYKK